MKSDDHLSIFWANGPMIIVSLYCAFTDMPQALADPLSLPECIFSISNNDFLLYIFIWSISVWFSMLKLPHGEHLGPQSWHWHRSILLLRSLKSYELNHRYWHNWGAIIGLTFCLCMEAVSTTMSTISYGFNLQEKGVSGPSLIIRVARWQPYCVWPKQ